MYLVRDLYLEYVEKKNSYNLIIKRQPNLINGKGTLEILIQRRYTESRGRCSTWQTFRGMQIKTTTRYQITTSRVAIIKNQTITSVDEEMDTLLWEWKMVHSLENSPKVQHRITIWPSKPTPRYNPERMENTCAHKNLTMNVHSSIICNSQRWQEPKCPPTGG